ncbi:hypothetical protein ACQ4PT_024139 [Festuca glaucescens]
MGSRVEGTVKWFNSTKGFGFITPKDGGEDIFVHQSGISVVEGGCRSLNKNDAVEYTAIEENDGRAKATDVTAPGGGPLAGVEYHGDFSFRRSASPALCFPFICLFCTCPPSSSEAPGNDSRNHRLPGGGISDAEGVNVVGFEVPTSPDSSYSNPIPGNEDEAREPPLVPPHLQHTLLSFPPSHDDSSSLPLPQPVVLNHLYIEKENSRSVVALGITHRFKAKFVTVVLYKPVQRR